MASRHRLCRAADIAEGTARGFDPFGEGVDRLFVVRHHGRLYAWRNACPHVAGAPMAWRRDQYLDRAASRIVCSAHGAQFDIASGACTLGPCPGQSLEAVAIECGCDGALYFVSDHS
jgi:nitrite reductase/ring-hydroxylating ferredoxin subunit